MPRSRLSTLTAATSALTSAVSSAASSVAAPRMVSATASRVAMLAEVREVLGPVQLVDAAGHVRGPERRESDRLARRLAGRVDELRARLEVLDPHGRAASAAERPVFAFAITSSFWCSPSSCVASSSVGSPTMRDPACSVRARTRHRRADAHRVSSAPRVDVDLRGQRPSRRCRSPASTPATSSRPTIPGDERRGIDATRRVEVDGAVEARRAAQDADDGDVLEGDATAVDEARLACEADPDDPPAGFDEVDGQGGDVRRVGGVDHAVERQRRQRTGLPDVLEPERRGEPGGGSRRATRWTSTPRALAISATSSPMVPAPTTSSRSPGVDTAASTARHALPPGSTSAPAVSSIASGRAWSDDAGTASRSASAPGQAVADPDLEPVRAQVLAAGPASVAAAAAEHRVARDAAPEPGGLDAGADRGHRAAPLVPDPERVRGLARVQVGHLAAEQLDVRAAHADPRDVDDDLARRRRGRIDLVDAARGPVPR